MRTNKEVYDFLSSAGSNFGIGFWKPGSGIIHQARCIACVGIMRRAWRRKSQRTWTATKREWALCHDRALLWRGVPSPSHSLEAVLKSMHTNALPELQAKSTTAEPAGQQQLMLLGRADRAGELCVPGRHDDRHGLAHAQRGRPGHVRGRCGRRGCGGCHGGPALGAQGAQGARDVITY